MTEQWKPDDLAVGTVRGVPDVRVVRKTGKWCWVSFSCVNGSVYHTVADVIDLRRVVILDPESDEDNDRFRSALGKAGMYRPSTGEAQQVLDILAAPKSAKIDEPTRLGAVVASGERKWVQVTGSGWYLAGGVNGPHWWTWANLPDDVQEVQP